MATELEATRENDARVAEAMGWRWWVLTGARDDRCRILLSPEATPCGGGWQGEWKGDETVRLAQGWQRNLGEWTADFALVVPMIERLAEVSDTSPRITFRCLSRTWCCEAGGDRWDGAMTANLAVAAALLSVWDPRKEQPSWNERRWERARERAVDKIQSGGLKRPWFCLNHSCEAFYQAQIYDPPRPGESGDCFGRMERPVQFSYDGVAHENNVNYCMYSPLKGVVCWQINREDIDAFRAVYENAAWCYDAQAKIRNNSGERREVDR